MIRTIQMLVAFFILLLPVTAAQTVEEKAAADKMDLIATQLEAAKTHPRKVQFKISEREANAFLRYSFQQAPRQGLDSAALKFFPNNYVSSYLVIDLDDVERWHPGTIPALLKSVLKGKKGIQVDARLNAVKGGLTFTIEKAVVSEVRVPAFVVQQILNVLAAQQPEHYDLSKPVPLPNGIQRLWTGDKLLNGEN